MMKNKLASLLPFFLLLTFMSWHVDLTLFEYCEGSTSNNLSAQEA